MQTGVIKHLVPHTALRRRRGGTRDQRLLTDTLAGRRVATPLEPKGVATLSRTGPGASVDCSGWGLGGASSRNTMHSMWSNDTGKLDKLTSQKLRLNVPGTTRRIVRSAVRSWLLERDGAALRWESRSGEGAAERRGGGATVKEGRRQRRGGVGTWRVTGMGVLASASRRHLSRRRRQWQHCRRRHADTVAIETIASSSSSVPSVPSASSASGGKGPETGAAPTKEQAEQVVGEATAGGDNA